MIDLAEMTEIIVYAQSGDYYRIRVPENPTTGYRWATECEGGVEVVQDIFERPAGNPTGSPGLRTFTVKVSKNGTVHLGMQRSWDFKDDIKHDASHRQVKFVVPN